MRAPRLLAGLLLPLLSAAAGCAGHAPPSAELRSSLILSSSPPPAGRICRIVEEPASLPAAEQLVDPQALREGLASLPAGVRQPGSYVLLSMGYDRFGTNIRRSVIEHTVEATWADSIQQLVHVHRRTAQPTSGEWGVRLRIGLEEPIRFAVGRQEHCAARPVDNRLAQALASPYSATIRDPDAVHETTVWLRLSIDPQGAVRAAEIERGVIRGAMTEYRVMSWVRTILFEPALADGAPVSSFVSIPIRLAER